MYPFPGLILPLLQMRKKLEMLRLPNASLEIGENPTISCRGKVTNMPLLLTLLKADDMEQARKMLSGDLPGFVNKLKVNNMHEFGKY